MVIQRYYITVLYDRCGLEIVKSYRIISFRSRSTIFEVIFKFLTEFNFSPGANSILIAKGCIDGIHPSGIDPMFFHFHDSIEPLGNLWDTIDRSWQVFSKNKWNQKLIDKDIFSCTLFRGEKQWSARQNMRILEQRFEPTTDNPVILSSEQGAGKNILIDEFLIPFVFGKNLSASINGVSKITQRFNTVVEDKYNLQNEVSFCLNLEYLWSYRTSNI